MRLKKENNETRIERIEREAARNKVILNFFCFVTVILVGVVFILLNNVSKQKVTAIEGNNPQELPLFQEGSNYCIYGKLTGQQDFKNISIRVDNEIAFIKGDEYLILSQTEARSVSIRVLKNGIPNSNFLVSLNKDRIRREDIEIKN